MDDLQHDALCDVLNPLLVDPRSCHACELLKAGRLAGVEGVAALAYERGRRDAEAAVHAVEVWSVPVVESDTPLTLAVRVKGLCADAALRGGSTPNP